MMSKQLYTSTKVAFSQVSVTGSERAEVEVLIKSCLITHLVFSVCFVKTKRAPVLTESKFVRFHVLIILVSTWNLKRKYKLA